MTTTQERVRSVIAERGESQRAFAQAVGIDETKLSKSLSGARRFSSTDLALIAAYTNVTVDWLITGEEPALAVAARSTGGSAAEALREAERLVDLRVGMEFVGYPQPWAPVDFTAQGRHVDQGRQLADAALARITELGLKITTPDLPRLIERAFGADVVVAHLGADFDGLAASAEAAKLILVGQSRVPTRQRFTLAHELGHLLAGDDQSLTVDVNVEDREHKQKATEMRANAFASALLMPEAMLAAAGGSAGFTPESFARLASQLLVSPAALAYRLFNLNLVNAGTRDRLRAMSSLEAADLAGNAEEFGRQVAIALTPRSPGLLLRDTLAAYQAGAATLRPYANLLGTDVDTLRSSPDFSEPESEDAEPS